MQPLHKFIGIYLPVISFIAVLVFLTVFADSVSALKELMSGMNLLSYTAYVLILVTAVVAMPVTVMPVIPMATALFGPFITAILSVIGWTVGGVIAFLVARYLGRPVLERYVSMQAVDELAAKIPEETRFLFIVLLRLTVPVDLVSYALGLSKTVGLIEYSVATFIGVIWFSFAFAYLGEAMLEGNTIILIELGTVSLLVFVVGWFLLSRQRKK